jgi:hypothetical protein
MRQFTAGVGIVLAAAGWHTVSFSPDGRRLLTMGTAARVGVKVFHAGTGSETLSYY